MLRCGTARTQFSGQGMESGQRMSMKISLYVMTDNHVRKIGLPNHAGVGTAEEGTAMITL